MITLQRKRLLIGLTSAAALALAAGFVIHGGTSADVEPRPAATAGATESAGSDPSNSEATRALALPASAGAKNPVLTTQAALVRLARDIQVIGTVAPDQDHFAVVGPLVSGRVAKLNAGVGDRLRRGQIIAEIESAEVGEARAALISAKARHAAAETNLRRETDLAERRISSSRERELAEAQWVTDKAGVRAAAERLRAIGLSNDDIEAIDKKDLGGRVPVRSPLEGTVIERTITLGQAVERATDAFKIADLTHLWVNLDLYEKDLARVRVGQEVEVRAEAFPGEVFRGRVAYVVPVIDEATRTAKVRLEFENRQGQLSLGQLVTARIVGDGHRGAPEVLAVPRNAVERVEGRPVVFVARDKDAFQQRTVELGASGGDLVEIRAGLAAGELVAVDGAFLLKSELLR
ncbi:MAG TPA: efflux RND transporter periplasmic adaptor subunit [Polyangia bacterium]|nr:efflux RND transporter periplasmic adaptor subunit [Polyangia bacterium]